MAELHGRFDRNCTYSLFELRSILPTTKMLINTITLFTAECNGDSLRRKLENYDRLWRDESRSQAFAVANSIGTMVKGTAGTKPHWSPKLDGSLLLQKCSASGLLR